MKKRFLSILLMLCMLVSLIPTALFPTAAETADTGTNAQASQNTVTSFKELYVGFDGSQTANGGVLSVLLTAFEKESSVDLANGKWNNAVQGATQHATVGGAWIAKTGGGIGYDLAKWDNSYFVSLDASLLPLDTYTVEIVSSVRGLTENADGVTPIASYATTSNLSLGRMRGFFWCGNAANNANYGGNRNSNSLVVMIVEAEENDGWSEVGTATGANGHWGNNMTAYRHDTSINTLSVKLTSNDTNYVYSFYKNGEDQSLEYTNVCPKGEADFVGNFVINRSMPATLYAVRLYTKPLTTAEMKQNRVVDILLKSGVDFSVYASLDDDFKDDFMEQIATKTMSVTSSEIEDIAENLAALAEAAKAARQKSEYDKLYVGADGSSTENGGHLTVLLSAYQQGSVSIDGEQGIWYDKMGNHDATLVGSPWKELEGGGVGYDMYYSASTGNDDHEQDVRLNLGIEALPSRDFTVEAVVSYDYLKIVDADGNITGDYKGAAWWNGVLADAVGQLKVVYERGGGTSLGGAHYCRYFLSPGAGGWYTGNYAHGGLYEETSRVTKGIYTQQFVRDLTVTDTETKATYTIMKNGAVSKSANYSSLSAVSTQSYQGNKYYDAEESETLFYLFNCTPVDVYAVRVYDAILTEHELAQNHFADLLACAGVNLGMISNLSAEQYAALVTSFAPSALTKDKVAMEEAINETLSFLKFEWNPEETLYVTDGLQLLLTSYDGFSTPARIGEGEVLWRSALGETTYGTMMGKGWYRSEDGGLKIRDTVPKSVADEKKVREYRRENRDDFYLSLDYGLLPEGDYTLETVLAPEGITVQNEDGTVSRYFDDFSSFGIYYERAFVLGAFRCMGFACYSHVSDGNMQRRWMYQSSGDWDHPPATGRVHVGFDNAFIEVADGEIVNYSISLNTVEDEKEGTTANYAVLYNRSISATFFIDAEKYMTNQEVIDKKFEVWRGLASTMYAIRLYDRVLTADEMLQNYVADVCYYLNLDVSLLEQALASIPDKATVFKAFAHLSFDMSKEEAQLALDNGMAGIWVKPVDVAVKGDMSDAVRFYFDLQYPAIAAIMQGGFNLEIGVMLNVGKDEMPSLENGAYDYRFVVFDSVSGINTKYFLDEDTFAVTLTYFDATSDLYNEKIRLATYVKLTDANGSSYFYGGLTNSGYASNTSLFTLYTHLSLRQNIIDNDFADYVNMIALGCYDDITVYFDSFAEGKGDGSENAPFTDFNDAFDACKAILADLDAPTNLTLHVASGIHRVGEIAEFDFDAVAFPKYNFTIEGDFEAEEAAELTTALNIPTEAFTAVEGKSGLYVYQFEPDENGNYPAFRNLYVDGWSATLAHSTPTTTAYGDFPYLSRFDRDVDGTYLKAKYYYDNGVLKDHSPEVEYAGKEERSDLIASYTEHYNQFLALGDKYSVTPVYGSRCVLYLHIDTVAALRATVEARLAELKANKDSWIAEEARLTALVEEKKAACDAASDAYRAAAILVQQEGATPEQFADCEAKRELLDAITAEYEALEAALKEAGLNIYDVTESYKTCLRDIGIELHAAAEWNYNIMDVFGIDFDDVVYYYDKRHRVVEEAVAVYMDPEQYAKFAIPSGFKMSDRQVYVANALEFVDATGEYYYDMEQGKLYYYSDSDIESLQFSYPTMDNMLVFHNARNVTVADLTIWGVDDYTLTQIGLAASQAGSNSTGSKELKQTGFSRRAAIACYNAYNVAVKDCYLHDIGGAAIYIEGRAEDVTISDNEIEMIGDAGIRIRGTAIANNEFSNRSGAERVYILRNYLHDIGRSIYNAPAVYMASAKDVEVANNTIMGCPYSGISIGWSWSVATWEEHDRYNLYNVNIHHNYITDFMQDLGDGGAIYVLGGNLKPDNPKQINFMHHNFVVFSDTTGNGSGMHVYGYYFDGASSNWSNYNNVLVEQSQGAERGAKAGANDRDYALYMRQQRSFYIFKQTHPDARSYNIHSTDNFIFNVRATSSSKQFEEVYEIGTNSWWNESGHKVVGTRYFYGADKLNFPTAIKTLIEETGSPLCPGDWTWLLSNEY